MQSVLKSLAAWSFVAITASSSAVAGNITTKIKPSFRAAPDASGVTYFLPARLLKVTATRTDLKKDELTKKLNSAEADWIVAQAAVASAKPKAAAAKALLASATAGSAAYAAISADADRAQVELKMALATESETGSDVTTAANALSALANGSPQCAFDLKVELMPVQPDLRFRFVALQNHSWFRDDSTTLAVSADGLLGSANGTSTGHAGDVIEQLAGAISAISTGGGKMGVEGIVPVTPATPSCSSVSEQTIKIIDPFAQQPTHGNTFPEMVGLNSDLAAYGFQIDLSMTAPPELTLATDDMKTVAARVETDGGGLFYRSPVPAIMTVRKCDPVTLHNCSTASADIVRFPQAGPVSYIPMKASLFVKTVSDVKFADGTITSWQADRPSEAVTIVSIPVRVLKAIVSVPAEILQLKVNYSTQSKSLVDLQKAQIESDEQLRVINACLALAKAKDDDTAALACLK